MRPNRASISQQSSGGCGRPEPCGSGIFTLPALALPAVAAMAAGTARQLPHAHLLVTNIFAWRATDPQEMKAVRDPVGRGNDRAILRAARKAAFVVCAWGNHGAHLGRAVQVRRILNGTPLHALHMNGSGEPAHPLY